MSTTPRPEAAILPPHLHTAVAGYGRDITNRVTAWADTQGWPHPRKWEFSTPEDQAPFNYGFALGVQAALDLITNPASMWWEDVDDEARKASDRADLDTRTGQPCPVCGKPLNPTPNGDDTCTGVCTTCDTQPAVANAAGTHTCPDCG